MSQACLRYYAKMAVHGALVLPAWPRVARPTLSVFTYHSFCPGRSPADFPSLPVGMFERQLGMLKRHYRLVGLSEGMRRLGEAEDGKPMAAITLDDGFADNYHVAFPALLRHQVPATVFIATDFIDEQRTPWPTRLMDIVNAIGLRHGRRRKLDVAACYRCYQNALRVLPAQTRFNELDRLVVEHGLGDLPQRPAMSWDQIREMRAAGIEFGSHTVFHGLLPFLSEAEVTSELVDSKYRIEEQLQSGCDYFAFPNGDYSSSVGCQLEKIGYKAAFTQAFGTNAGKVDSYVMKRIEVPFHDPLASFAYRGRKALAAMEAR